MYVVVVAVSALYLLELNRITSFIPYAERDYLVVAALAIIGLGIIALTIDLYMNFEDLKDDRAYAMFGRTGLATGMLLLSVVAMTAIAIAWRQVDPTIFETRSNIIFFVEAGDTMAVNDYLLFALDQTQKALLFDVSEVYRFGLIDIGNNPQNYAFSTACLIYRTFLSMFVLVIGVRLLRKDA